MVGSVASELLRAGSAFRDSATHVRNAERMAEIAQNAPSQLRGLHEANTQRALGGAAVDANLGASLIGNAHEVRSGEKVARTVRQAMDSLRELKGDAYARGPRVIVSRDGYAESPARDLLLRAASVTHGAGAVRDPA